MLVCGRKEVGQVTGCLSRKIFEGENAEFETEALWNGQLVGMMLDDLGDYSYCCVSAPLQFNNRGFCCTNKESVTVI